ncbi:transporter substrate-binding domain-containing protein [Roseobacter sp.]|uniref:substrate-binding periplasmic protein n=1 Tax=Roseobacter sp. TaxID=1907202 RepID=UPI00329982DC
MRSLVWCFLLGMSGAFYNTPQAIAQDTTVPENEPPLIVGASIFPPISVQNADGTWSGYAADLARALSEETGIAIEFKAFENPADVIGALIAGQVDMLPALVKLPVTLETTVFSTPVAVEFLRLIAKPALAASLSHQPIHELRIGVIPPVIGSDMETLFSHNTPVEFASVDASLVALLVDEIDALLIPNSLAYTRFRAADLEHLFGFIDPPIRTVERYMPLHKSRANLMLAINAGLARMQADGRLERLSRQYVIDIPPYKLHNDDGTFSGFSVEMIQDLAELPI